MQVGKRQLKTTKKQKTHRKEYVTTVHDSHNVITVY